MGVERSLIVLEVENFKGHSNKKSYKTFWMSIIQEYTKLLKSC